MSHWYHACRIDDIEPWSGAAALFSGVQVALIRSGDDIHALGNLDPFSGAQVIARGIVGDLGGVPVVASPMYKQHFRLSDGVCVEDAQVRLPVYAVRIEHGDVFVELGTTNSSSS
jgi:NAD(P)H-dependent nitrite reductase small subunit